jgi:hypothetical protein
MPLKRENTMHRQFRRLITLLAILAPLAVLLSAEDLASRKLGPDTLKSIGLAKLDPAFQTTKLDRIALLPFANAAQFKEAAGVISKNFVSQLSQLHSEYKFLPPDETINFISTSGMNDEFNVFLGDYLSAGTARKDFLDNMHNKLQIDAVLVGHVTQYGEVIEIGTFLGKPVRRKLSVVGVDMSLYRTTDGRRVWYGRDRISAGNKNKLPDAAQAISEVFARYFGRTPY